MDSIILAFSGSLPDQPMMKFLEIISLLFSTDFAIRSEDSTIALALTIFSSISLAPGDSILPLMIYVALVICWLTGEDNV